MMDSQDSESELEELLEIFDQLSPEDNAWAIILVLFLAGSRKKILTILRRNHNHHLIIRLSLSAAFRPVLLFSPALAGYIYPLFLLRIHHGLL